MIDIKYFDGEIQKIHKIPQGDWVDLRSRIKLHGVPGDYREIPLGVAMVLPEGYEAHLLPRSSSFRKYGFIQTNSMGVIEFREVSNFFRESRGGLGSTGRS